MDAAESELSGEVDPQVAGGVIRYRVRPARRHPWRTLLATIMILAATGAAWYVYESIIWTVLTPLGLTATLTVFFFPTTVTLDGPLLHIRQFGTPRTFDLRLFRRIEVSQGLLRRVELGLGPTAKTRDHVSGTTVPLPVDDTSREKVLVHLRRWIGRRPSGIFELDADLAPEDQAK